MARRLVRRVKVAAAVALLLDGGEELVDRAAAAHRSGRLPHAVNELALVRAAEQREEMLARTVEALKNRPCGFRPAYGQVVDRAFSPSRSIEKRALTVPPAYCTRTTNSVS